MTNLDKLAALYRVGVLAGGPQSSLAAGDCDIGDAELRDIVQEIGSPPYAPEPRDDAGWPCIAKPFFRRMVSQLHEMVDVADLNNPEEFHTLLFMAVGLGAVQQFIARDQFVAPSIVNRWVNARQTPDARRRRGILASALLSLDDSIESGSHPAVTTFTGRRANPLKHGTPR